MTFFAPIPSWDKLHPLITHLPLVLLLVAPLFVILGALRQPEKGRPFLVTAFILVMLGTIAVIVAVQTGEAAAKFAGQTPAIEALLTRHQKLAETTQALFCVLTLAFGALVFVPSILHRELGRQIHAELLAAYLIFYLSGALFLVNTARQGERIVYEYRVKAQVSGEDQGPGSIQAENHQALTEQDRTRLQSKNLEHAVRSKPVLKKSEIH